MVCVLLPELNQSISRSSSLKGIRSTRKPTRAASGRFEDVVTSTVIIRQHKEASLSPERNTEPHEDRIVEAVRELYSCSAVKVCDSLYRRTPRLSSVFQSSFGVYSRDVSLHDDSGMLLLSGIDKLREHFTALQRVCAELSSARTCAFLNP